MDKDRLISGYRAFSHVRGMIAEFRFEADISELAPYINAVLAGIPSRAMSFIFSISSASLTGPGPPSGRPAAIFPSPGFGAR
jgi:hypothetical protein